MTDAEFEENSVRMGTALTQLLEALNERCVPFVIGIQMMGERPADGRFPGILTFQLPSPADTGLLMACAMMKEGFAKALEGIVPGIENVEELAGDVAQKKMAELEQGDDRVKASHGIYIPKRFLSLPTGDIKEDENIGEDDG